MRRIVVLLIGCVAILAMSGNVSAESFNDRGVNWIMAAPEGSSQPRISVKPRLVGFNGRVNWIMAAPKGSSQPRISVRPRLAGFNDRSVDDWATAASAGSNRAYFAIVLDHQ